MMARSKTLNHTNKSRIGGKMVAMAAAFAVTLGTASQVYADDPEDSGVEDGELGFAGAPIDDHALSQTVGVGEDAVALFQGSDPSDDGSIQSVDIGSINGDRGFGNNNAVAVSVIQQNAVQIIGPNEIFGAVADQ